MQYEIVIIGPCDNIFAKADSLSAAITIVLDAIANDQLPTIEHPSPFHWRFDNNTFTAWIMESHA